MPRGHPMRRLLRARRVEAAAWRQLRHERLRLGADIALAQERGYVGALILEPSMIGVMATRRPPAWFTDPGCLAVVRALHCLRHVMERSVRDVVTVLEKHDALELAGGREAVEALLEPGPHLEIARAHLAAVRAELGPVERDPLVQLARVLLDAAPCDS